MDGLGGPRVGADGGKGYFADPPEVILNLLLFVLQLKRIRKHLPAAAAADAKMRAKRLDAFRGVFSKSDDLTFSPIFFIFGEPDIDDIARNGVLDEDYLPVHPGQGFAFCGIVFNEYPLQ